MRLFFFPALAFAAALQAQDAPPPSGAGTGEKPAPPAETKPVEGSLRGTEAPSALSTKPRVSAAEKTNYPSQYLYFVSEAMKSFQARDFVGALAYANRADELVPPTVWTLNVRGAVAIEQLNFEEGRKLCMEALKMEPGFFPAKFNLCEIPFLQKNYAEARRGWNELFKAIPPEDPTAELLIYRIFLTYLLEEDKTHAKEWLEKIPFPSQTPAYQYAHAAWERQAGNLDKWKEWLESAEFIWPLVKRANFLDVLVQLKWIENQNFSPN